MVRGILVLPSIQPTGSPKTTPTHPRIQLPFGSGRSDGQKVISERESRILWCEHAIAAGGRIYGFLCVFYRNFRFDAMCVSIVLVVGGLLSRWGIASQV